MKMKQLFIQLAVVGILLSLAACQNEAIPEETGDKIALSFNLYQVELTKAETGASTLPEGTKLRAYAYTKGDATTGKPVSYGDYAVNIVNNTGIAKATDGAGLTLYRGDYDIYLVSYNDKDYVPETEDDNLLHVSNGKDFMYSALKGITVQPTSGGTNMMSVDLPEPFTRLCSQVIVTVAANNNISQPVPFTTLVVSSVNINKLSSDLSYQMGETSWMDNSVSQTGKKETLSSFTNNNGGNIYNLRESTPLVVLPLTGNEPLEFELNLNIGFTKDANPITKLFTYTPKVYKSFLPGMTYQFDFTLTFFGDQEPTDLSLAILEYTTVKFSTDDVGK